MTVLDALALEGRLPAQQQWRLESDLERLRLQDSVMLRLPRELEALEVLRGLPDADADLLATLERLVSGTAARELLDVPERAAPAVVLAAAWERTSWAMALASASGTRLEQAQAARTVRTTFARLVQQLQWREHRRPRPHQRGMATRAGRTCRGLLGACCVVAWPAAGGPEPVLFAR